MIAAQQEDFQATLNPLAGGGARFAPARSAGHYINLDWLRI